MQNQLGENFNLITKPKKDEKDFKHLPMYNPALIVVKTTFELL